jgi:uncharacterized protein (TIGR02145 family)
MPGINQPQGSCTFTQPTVVGTFASFPSNYSASTYVTLTDARDNKNYEVVKIGGRWIMARNLNYQKGLTWQTNSNQPTTTTGQDLKLIGNFWCPGSGGTSTRTTCDVYGALYSWETAMSFDGLGAWTESPSTYNTGAANTAAAKVNHGRTTNSSGRGGRGICPKNWHVPTDYEWGVFFDAVEGGGTAHQSASDIGWYGSNAGQKSKAACTGTATDGSPLWTNNASAEGTDSYGFRVLPAGIREADGSTFRLQGNGAWFWSSSSANSSFALVRSSDFDHAEINRWGNNRSTGFSVRCIRDEN